MRPGHAICLLLALSALPARAEKTGRAVLLLIAGPARDLCIGQGPPRTAPPLLFEVPGLSAPDPSQIPGCTGEQGRPLPDEVADSALPHPLKERSTYYGLRLDGSTVPVQVSGALLIGDKVVLGARPFEAKIDAKSEVPDGGADGGTAPDAGVAPTPPPASAGPPIVALLLQPAAAAPAPVPPNPASISGVVRRRVGRQSLVVHGRFAGNGTSWTAIFKRRAEAVQLAIFGEEGALRLYQTLPWRPARPPRARPVMAYPIADLSAPGRDGLLITGSSDTAISAALILEFTDKSVTSYSPSIE